MPIDTLITRAQEIALWLREQAMVVHEAGLEDLAKEMVVRANGHEKDAAWALAAPADESMVGSGWVDQIHEDLKMPWRSPTRPQIVFVVTLLRRARGVVLHYAQECELLAPPETVAAGQRLLNDINGGPPTDPQPTRHRTRPR